MLSWLTVLGLEEHADTISGYVSESTALKDLLGMLIAEQEDEDEEDLKDLIKDMEIDVETAATFREAIGKLKVLLEEAEQVAKAAKEAAAKAAKEAQEKASAAAKAAEEANSMDNAWAILIDELRLETNDGATVESLRAVIAELRAKYEPEEGTPARDKNK